MYILFKLVLKFIMLFFKFYFFLVILVLEGISFIVVVKNVVVGVYYMLWDVFLEVVRINFLLG